MTRLWRLMMFMSGLADRIRQRDSQKIYVPREAVRRATAKKKE